MAEEDTEKNQDVYWLNPEVTAVSVGSIDNLRPTNGKVRVPVSTAIYLVSVRPDLFGIAPPATGIAGTVTHSAPEKIKE